MKNLIKRFTWNKPKKPTAEDIAIAHIHKSAADLIKVLEKLDKMIERLDNNQKVLTEFLIEETKRVKIANQGEQKRLTRAEDDLPNLYDRRY